MQMYIDDVIIYSKNEEEGVEKLKKVLNLAAAYGLNVKWQKCKFLQYDVVYLGSQIKGGYISPDVEKSVAIKNFSYPKSVKQLQQKLGLFGYFRKFVQNYSIITKPLTDLLKKDAEFMIGPEQTVAIEKIKNVLSNQPVLRIFSNTACTKLHTDASKDGFGGILFQSFAEKLHPVYFWSRKSTVEESRLHSFYMENKAAYYAVKKEFLIENKLKID